MSSHYAYCKKNGAWGNDNKRRGYENLVTPPPPFRHRPRDQRMSRIIYVTSGDCLARYAGGFCLRITRLDFTRNAKGWWFGLVQMVAISPHKYLNPYPSIWLQSIPFSMNPPHDCKWRVSLYMIALWSLEPNKLCRLAFHSYLKGLLFS